MSAVIARSVLWIVWQAIRLPVFSLLLILEPIVRRVLSWLALWTFLIAFVWKFSGAAPSFPFWAMLAFSASCALALTAYYALLRLFSR
jgi:hypothetical protein